MTTSPTCIPYINMYFFSISNMGPWLKSLWIVLVSIMTLPWLSKILNINNSQSFLIYICYHLYKINICITWYFFHAIFNDPDFLFIFLTLCNVFFFFHLFPTIISCAWTKLFIWFLLWHLSMVSKFFLLLWLVHLSSTLHGIQCLDWISSMVMQLLTTGIIPPE